MKTRSFLSGIFLILGIVSTAGAHGPAPMGESPWTALKELQAGNKRFCAGRAQHRNQDPVRRSELSQGQKPSAIVVSCSDSRVPPEIVFDKGLGEIFSIRLAGHVLNPEAIASIEYAVEHLGTRLIVIMGHESCGAVKAALTTPEGTSAGSDSLDHLLAQIRRNIKGHSGNPADKTLAEPVQTHVGRTAQDLVRRSKILQEKVIDEKVIVAQAVYSLASGKTTFTSVSQSELKQLAESVSERARVPASEAGKEK